MDNLNTLAERLEWAIAAKCKRDGLRKITQTQLAEVAGVNKVAVSNWLSDKNGMSAEQARKIGPYLGVNALWLETGDGQPQKLPVDSDSLGDDLLAIRRVEFKISAGVSGFVVEYLNGEKDPIFFRQDWVVRSGFNPDYLHAIEVHGQSMEPRLWEGDIVIVNTADTAMKDGEPYAFNYEGEVLIKRLKRDNGNWYMASDNPDKKRYPHKLCEENCFIIGRIVYKQSDRI